MSSYQDYEDLDRDLEDKPSDSVSDSDPYLTTENRRCALRAAVDSLPEGSTSRCVLHVAEKYFRWIQTGEKTQ